MEGGKVGTGGRWVRGKGGDGEGEGTENQEKNSGQEGEFSKHGAILTHTSPSLVGTIFYLPNAMCPVPKCLEVLWRCNLVQGKTVRLAAKYGTMLNTCNHNNTNETTHIHHVHCS